MDLKFCGQNIISSSFLPVTSLCKLPDVFPFVNVPIVAVPAPA
jgi:hypothetical protein